MLAGVAALGLMGAALSGCASSASSHRTQPLRRHRSTVPKAAVLPPQPHVCEPSRAAKQRGVGPVTTLRLSNVLPSPLAHVRVGARVQVIAAYHGKVMRIPWVTKGARLVCRVASGRGQKGEAYLTVRASAPGNVAFLSLDQQATAAMSPALAGRIAIFSSSQ